MPRNITVAPIPYKLRKTIPDYYSETNALKLDKMREEARLLRRITYDCFGAVTFGEKVVCKQGYPLSATSGHSLPLISVLRGRSSSICQKCPDYNGD